MCSRSSKSSHFLRPRPGRSERTDPVPAHARNTAEEHSPQEIEAAIALMMLANSTQELPTSKSQMIPTIDVVDSRDKGKPAEKDSSTSPVEQDTDSFSDTSSPRGPKNASLKRPLSSQVKKPRKRAKPEREATPVASEDADISLPLHSIRAINVPVRKDPGPPRPKSFPYGCLVDHQDSMLIYWLDEEGRTYPEATELWAEKYPRNKLGLATIRRRHISVLKRLANEYGIKTWEQIDAEGPVWEHTKRRGKKQNKPVPTLPSRKNRKQTYSNLY